MIFSEMISTLLFFCANGPISIFSLIRSDFTVLTPSWRNTAPPFRSSCPTTRHLVGPAALAKRLKSKLRTFNLRKRRFIRIACRSASKPTSYSTITASKSCIDSEEWHLLTSPLVPETFTTDPKLCNEGIYTDLNLDQATTPNSPNKWLQGLLFWHGCCISAVSNQIFEFLYDG